MGEARCSPHCVALNDDKGFSHDVTFTFNVDVQATVQAFRPRIISLGHE